MIRVEMKDEDGNIIAQMSIIRTDSRLPDEALGDYVVHYAMERDVHMVGLHRRAVNRFERLRYNPLGLLKAALEPLTDTELELEDGARPCDLARGFKRAWKALPGETQDPFSDH